MKKQIGDLGAPQSRADVSSAMAHALQLAHRNCMKKPRHQQDRGTPSLAFLVVACAPQASASSRVDETSLLAHSTCHSFQFFPSSFPTATCFSPVDGVLRSTHVINCKVEKMNHKTKNNTDLLGVISWRQCFRPRVVQQAFDPAAVTFFPAFAR